VLFRRDADGAELEVVHVDVDAATDEMIDQLADRGVEHGDIREANIVWNEELGRLMLIDFDQAEMFTPTPVNDSNDDTDGVGGIRGVSDIRDIHNIHDIHDIHDVHDSKVPHKRYSTVSVDAVKSKRVKTL
jgi:serine/threonine protein kinase